MIKVTVIEREGLRSYTYFCNSAEEASVLSVMAQRYSGFGGTELDVVIERASDSDSFETNDGSQTY